MAGDRPAALVTGSASGIGRAAALRLARAGYDVAINYRRSEDSARRTLADLSALGGRAIALRGDVSDDDAVAAMAAAVDEAYGRLDVLVNNAGMTSTTPPDDLDGVDLAEWDRVFAERRATWTPMQRNVTVADVAETIYSLVAANPFVTGETIVIDGGYSATT